MTVEDYAYQIEKDIVDICADMFEKGLSVDKFHVTVNNHSIVGAAERPHVKQ